MDKPLKLYSDLAPWFHLLTHPDEYAEEAEFYRRAILAHCTFPPRTLLPILSLGRHDRTPSFEVTRDDSGAVRLVATRHGGHTGFIAGSSPFRVRYWAEERAVEFVAGRLVRI